MTLILGIKCSDGIVLGADGAATNITMGTQTIRQQVKKKLFVIADQIVIGTSGPVGLGQRFKGVVDSLYRNGSLFKDPATSAYRRPHELMTFLRIEFWKHIELEIQIAMATTQVLAPNLTMNDALAWSLVALPVPNERTPCLFQFDQQASPEEATDDLPFAAIGSGQLIADPFLAFMRRIYWPDRLPTLAEGTLAAYWTLHHAIETHPGGVADPKQVVLIREEKKGVWKARELSKEEGEEHLEHVKKLEKCITDFDKEDQHGSPPTPPILAS